MTTNNYLVNIAENYLETAVYKSADDLVALVGSEGLVADPRFGICSGEPKLKEFTASFQGWLKAFSPKVQHLRTTATEKRVCSEDILFVDLGHEKWEVAVGTVVCNQESGSGAKVHVYYTNWPFNNHSHSLRPALFDKPEPGVKQTGVIQRYFEILSNTPNTKYSSCLVLTIIQQMIRH